MVAGIGSGLPTMDQWMVGWMDEWMDGWKDEWRDGWWLLEIETTVNKCA